jgi:hypothetical protein
MVSLEELAGSTVDAVNDGGVIGLAVVIVGDDGTAVHEIVSVDAEARKQVAGRLAMALQEILLSTDRSQLEDADDAHD